jgi:hypothetical protein
MTIDERINAFATLGKSILDSYNDKEQNYLWKSIGTAHIENPWFTPDFCEEAILSIAHKWLNKDKITSWVSNYPERYFAPRNPKKTGVVMAGNIPFVGVHDLICVLVSGHYFMGKISSKDGGLMQAFVNILLEVEPRFDDHLSVVKENLQSFDAVIATGSDNSARYFEYYFGKFPNIIRKNRHSVAILSGKESKVELNSLLKDIFTYFGLGCRNVSKILIPKDYDLSELINEMNSFKYLLNHNKYANNYEYHRALYIMNGFPHYDNGFVLLKPDDGLGSPVGVLFYQSYESYQQIIDYIKLQRESLQCIVSSINEIPKRIAFGKTQQPEISDYMDGIDTLEFLGNL